MAKYRSNLPQLDGGFFLTDSGLETTLIFHDGMDLPHFAAFDLLRGQAGKQKLRDYYHDHAAIAHKDGVGFVLESPTWRANRDWATKLGYTTAALAQTNLESIELMEELRNEFETPLSPMVISGCIGPRGDGYNPEETMTPGQAEAYHTEQIAIFGKSAADMVTAVTMTNTNEAIGIARAAKNVGIPVVIAFTVETDGRLPTGQSLAEAITQVDAETASAPAYYMVNCAHPTHFAATLKGSETWLNRIRGLRANASRCSHAELDEAETLDSGNPVELAKEYQEITNRLTHVNVLGGCCGTDLRHIEQISNAHRARA